MSGHCEISHISTDVYEIHFFFFSTETVLVNLLLCLTPIQITFLIEITSLTFRARVASFPGFANYSAISCSAFCYV